LNPVQHDEFSKTFAESPAACRMGGSLLEGHGRHANLDDWKGENKSSNSIGQGLTNSVEWFYLEELDDVTGDYYRSIFISDISPEAPGIRNVRPANISYSGISIRLGIRLSFGNR
jgi:hypothetical protein